jgi:hypothetical protein
MILHFNRFPDFNSIVGTPHNLLRKLAILIGMGSAWSSRIGIRSEISAIFIKNLMNGIRFEWLPP